MEKEFSTFRKSTFGGFNRKDVISYIEKMRNESFEYKKQVEETVKSLNEKIIELENAARLMEADAFEAEAPEADAPEDDAPVKNMSDINDATKHLKAVADELCRSLGEFMEKLSSRGLFEQNEEALSEAQPAAPELAEEAEESLVDGILSSLSFLYEGKAEEKPVSEIKNEGKAESTVSDILGILSFLN